MNFAGLIFDDSLHYLDHLAPFCSILGCPLIICDKKIAHLARMYYPDVQIIESSTAMTLPPVVVSCDPKLLLKEYFPGQKFCNIWLPHGNSDKGKKTGIFKALKENELALVYGQKMIDFIREQEVNIPTLVLGNFRLKYYLKHNRFYESVFPLEKRYVIYAPTWEDREGNGTFWKRFRKLGGNYNLMIKLHPNTSKKFALELEIVKEQYPEFLFIEEFPSIYHLLHSCDAYIGDMSSIGYDFLYFDKPLHFFTQGHDLEPCGSDTESRKQMYHYTFGQEPNWAEIKGFIERASCFS